MMQTEGKVTDLTEESLKDAIRTLGHVHHSPQLPKRTVRWFEHLMNRLGWYRQTEVIVIEESRLRSIFQPFRWGGYNDGS